MRLDQIDHIPEARDVSYDLLADLIADALDEGAKRHVRHAAPRPDVALDLVIKHGLAYAGYQKRDEGELLFSQRDGLTVS